MTASILTAAQYRERVTEAQMETAIRELVGNRGRVFHIRDSRASPEMVDFPDLVVMLPERGLVVFVELKSQTRKVTAGQADVMGMLARCARSEAFIVRPRPKDGAIGELSYDALMDWLQEVEH